MAMNADLKKLQGTWNIVALETDGHAMADAASMGAKIVIDGDRFSSVSMGAVYKGVVRLDAAQKPKAFDLEFTEGPEKGNTNYGIYELDGDIWKICLNTLGKGRPKKFGTAAGSGLALETLTRGSGEKIGDRQRRPRAGGQRELPSGDGRLGTAKPVPNFLESPSGKGRLGTAKPVPDFLVVLDGEWAMVRCVQSGKALDAEYLKHGKRVAHGNETKITMAGRVIVDARYTVDGDAMDYFLAGGKMQHGIWRMKGETLTVCFAAPGKARPAEFASKAGDGRTFVVWKLVKR